MNLFQYPIFRIINELLTSIKFDALFNYFKICELKLEITLTKKQSSELICNEVNWIWIWWTKFVIWWTEFEIGELKYECWRTEFEFGSLYFECLWTSFEFLWTNLGFNELKFELKKLLC